MSSAVVYGVTGTRVGATVEQLKTLRKLTEDKPPTVARHGDCVGVDAEFAELMRDWYGARIIGHPPDKDGNRAFFPSDDEFEPQPYLIRDADVVRLCHHLFALPRGEKEVRRGSGTWATIRIARRVKRNHTIIFPDGKHKTVVYSTDQLD